MWHMKHLKVSRTEKKIQPSGKKKRFPPYMYKKNLAKSFGIRRPLAANGRQAGSKMNSGQLPLQLSALRFSFDDGTRRGTSTRWAVLRWTPFRRVRFCVCWWAFSWANLLYLPYCYEEPSADILWPSLLRRMLSSDIQVACLFLSLTHLKYACKT